MEGMTSELRVPDSSIGCLWTFGMMFAAVVGLPGSPNTKTWPPFVGLIGKVPRPCSLFSWLISRCCLRHLLQRSPFSHLCGFGSSCSMATIETDSAGVTISRCLEAFRPRRFLPPDGVVDLVRLSSWRLSLSRPRSGDVCGTVVHGRLISWKGVGAGLRLPSPPRN